MTKEDNISMKRRTFMTKGHFHDKEGSFYSKMTSSVDICKQLSSLNFTNVKFKSKQILKWKLLECAIY